VLLDANSHEKPDIEYPCEWRYKIIGTDKSKLRASIFDVMEERKHSIKEGNTSSKGKFHSLNTACQVESEEDRDILFKAFQDHDDVKMVI